MQRRRLLFQQFDEVISDCRLLLENGYHKTGNWSLGQICQHMRVTQDANMDGYPGWMSLFAGIRPVLRWALLPKLLRGDSPKGLRTAGMFVPGNELDDLLEFDAYVASIERFRRHDKPLYPHPGFGRMSHQDAERFHAAHASHHLGFLVPVEDRGD